MIDETGSLPERIRRAGKFALLRREPGDAYFDIDQWRRRSGGPMPLALYWTPFRTGAGLAAMGTSSREFIGYSVEEIFLGPREMPDIRGVFRWMRDQIEIIGDGPWLDKFTAPGTVLGDLLKVWPAEALPRLAKCASLAEAEIVMEAYGG